MSLFSRKAGSSRRLTKRVSPVSSWPSFRAAPAPASLRPTDSPLLLVSETELMQNTAIRSFDRMAVCAKKLKLRLLAGRVLVQNVQEAAGGCGWLHRSHDDGLIAHVAPIESFIGLA